MFHTSQFRKQDEFQVITVGLFEEDSKSIFAYKLFIMKLYIQNLIKIQWSQKIFEAI